MRFKQLIVAVLPSDEEAATGDIIDATETNLVALRRVIYLTIQSSLDFEECVHKLLKMELKPGQEVSSAVHGSALKSSTPVSMHDLFY